MTTIAYRDGIMAGDTQVEWAAEASGICAGFERKVFTFPGGLMAISGDAGQGDNYMTWLKEGRKGVAEYADNDDPVDFFALVIFKDGSMWKSEDGGRLQRQLGTFCAIGSGYSAAMAAMRHGATPREAVETASVYDPATGGEILTVSLEVLK